MIQWTFSLSLFVVLPKAIWEAPEETSGISRRQFLCLTSHDTQNKFVNRECWWRLTVPPFCTTVSLIHIPVFSCLVQKIFHFAYRQMPKQSLCHLRCQNFLAKWLLTNPKKDSWKKQTWKSTLIYSIWLSTLNFLACTKCSWPSTTRCWLQCQWFIAQDSCHTHHWVTQKDWMVITGIPMSSFKIPYCRYHHSSGDFDSKVFFY